ncbi:hypothetical protein [Methyloferula stellata]|uniref:hypothetical protein n=1 Tax=Methyloferula stellata TaxID=876270 RepID=UPI00035C1D86|nr:hypothetical protein [Methyloferula stellata]
MPTHRFKIGSVVTLSAEGQPASTASRYIVEAQMPPVGTQLQYRIKSETENFRRVVVEHQLTSFSLSPVTAPTVGPGSEGASWPSAAEES